MSLNDDLTDAWSINDRINRFLLEAVPEEALGNKADKARSVRGQFAHIISVRGMWLKSADSELFAEFPEFDKDKASKAELASALESSGSLIRRLIAQSLEEGRNVKGFRPTVAAFVGYLIAHEAHHRGMAELVLRQTGAPVSDKASYGLWEWGVR